MFSEVPRKARTPLIPSDHPELDTTEFCGREDQALPDPDWLTTVAHHFGKIGQCSLCNVPLEVPCKTQERPS